MPKRKKHPRLPSGFGSIRYLGKGRACPYAVHPPCKSRDDLGFYVRPAALCYVPDWYTGFAVLTAFHAGNYTPGLELTIRQEVRCSTSDLDLFCQRVLKDSALLSTPEEESGQTFAEVYQAFFEHKFGKDAPRRLSTNSQYAYRQGFNHLAPVHDIPIDRITLDQLQKIVNDCSLNHGSRRNIVLTCKGVYKYALPRHLCKENTAAFLVIPEGREDESGVPFSDADLRVLWANKTDPIVEMILIMCYSGFRISAFLDMEIDLKERSFRGGVKTSSGKNRIVPIHSAIFPIVEKRLRNEAKLLTNTDRFRRKMYQVMKSLGLSDKIKHTPHDCRHTFSRLCESYGVRESDRKRMMGHSFGSDITNGIYGHRTLEELREEIEKIKVPSL